MSQHTCDFGDRVASIGRGGARMTMVVGQPVPPNLGAARVVTAANKVRSLGESWAERDAVVIFVRHFACAGCSAHVADLRPRLEEIAGLEVTCVLVGNGTPDQLAGFTEREKLDGYPIELVTDPSRAAYLAADLERSWIGTTGPRAAANFVGLLARGYRNGRPQGDLNQQGGTLYVTREGVLGFYHHSARLGDNASVTDVVDIALARAVERAASSGL
ncbi:MAG: AhpC/TSA family protein [Kofleriaceae bacterium]